MKETIKNIDKEMQKLTLKPKKGESKESMTVKLLKISEEQWKHDQEIAKIENQIWRLRNEKLSHCDNKAHLERLKTEIYVMMGFTQVKIDKRK